MPHTNQIKKIIKGAKSKALGVIIPSYTIKQITDALDELTETAISQTEQECDKRWRDKIQAEKDRLTTVMSKAIHERNKLIFKEKIETLDDLLK